MPVETQTQSFTLPGLTIPTATAANLVPVEAPPQLVDVKRAVTATATELKTSQRELDTLKRGSWNEAQYGRLQKLRNFVVRKRMTKAPSTVVWPILGTVAGVIGGIVAGINLESWAAAIAATGAGLTLGVSIPLGALTTIKLGERQEKSRLRYMLEPKALKKPLQRFAKASGIDQLQVAFGLRRLREELHRSELLSPEALAALNVVNAEADKLIAADRGKAERYASLARLLTDPLGRTGTETLKQTLAQATPTERPVLAQAMYDLVFADRRRIATVDYGQRNWLLEVLIEAGAKPAIETGA